MNPAPVVDGAGSLVGCWSVDIDDAFVSDAGVEVRLLSTVPMSALGGEGDDDGEGDAAADAVVAVVKNEDEDEGDEGEDGDAADVVFKNENEDGDEGDAGVSKETGDAGLVGVVAGAAGAGAVPRGAEKGRSGDDAVRCLSLRPRSGMPPAWLRRPAGLRPRCVPLWRPKSKSLAIASLLLPDDDEDDDDAAPASWWPSPASALSATSSALSSPLSASSPPPAALPALLAAWSAVAVVVVAAESVGWGSNWTTMSHFSSPLSTRFLKKSREMTTK
jgi:hypothetical protein